MGGDDLGGRWRRGGRGGNGGGVQTFEGEDGGGFGSGRRVAEEAWGLGGRA